MNIEKGENIAVWLKDGAEKYITLLAAAKAGVKVIDAPDGGELNVKQLRQFLTIAAPKAIYFDPQIGNRNQLELLRMAIPEFFDYDDQYGQLFHSKYWPSLRFFIHTGYDLECGCLNYKRLFIRNPTISRLAERTQGTSDTDLLYMKTKIAKSGDLVAGDWQSHSAVQLQNLWNIERMIREKKYFEL